MSSERSRLASFRSENREASPEAQKKANRPSGERSRTRCVFFELKGDQLLIFPGGTSVIRRATHGVIYASRSYEREHGHWTRITRFDPSSSSPSSSPSRLPVSLYRRRIKSFIVRRAQKKVMKLSRRIHERAPPPPSPPAGTRGERDT